MIGWRMWRFVDVVIFPLGFLVLQPHSSRAVSAFRTIPSATFIRVSDRETYVLKRHPGLVSFVLAVIGALSLSVLASFLLLAFIRWPWKRRRSGRFKIDASIEADLKADANKFSYKELARATSNFSPKQSLGKGGFGSVYRGVLRGTGQEVAIKRVSEDSSQGEPEFLAEVRVLGKIRHRNLVRLHGWCHERGELLLVYDYMPGGSLDKLLFADGGTVARSNHIQPTKSCHIHMSFPWEKRFKIVRDIAAALVYLHDECEERIIHRDVKAGNVMLDGNCNGRLGDFGLARSYRHSMCNPKSTAVAGTYGYFAPELYLTGRQTDKTDVFSYGAFLLTVACGKEALYVDPSDPLGKKLLLDTVWKMWENSQLLDCADPKLAGVYDSDELYKVLCLGLLCSHRDPECRPSMRQVLLILSGDAVLPPLPKSKPKLKFAFHEVFDDQEHSSTTAYFSASNRFKPAGC